MASISGEWSHSDGGVVDILRQSSQSACVSGVCVCPGMHRNTALQHSIAMYPFSGEYWLGQ